MLKTNGRKCKGTHCNLIVCACVHVHDFLCVCMLAAQNRPYIYSRRLKHTPHRLFCCTNRSKGGQYLRSTDDVTPVELFLKHGLKKADFFFSILLLFLECYYYSKRSTSQCFLISACLISLFWSIWSLQLWHFTVVGPPVAYTHPIYWLLSAKHTQTQSHFWKL